MKYFLYETGKKFQTLENEITHIKDYIEIEKLRYKDDLKIKFEIIGEIKKTKIKPLLLIPFVENAFKHGANKSIDKIKIDIDFNVEDDFLKFKVVNPIPIKPKKKQLFNRNQGGIGLSNVKKRLELGYKKEDYGIFIDNSNNQFVVELKIRVS